MTCLDIDLIERYCAGDLGSAECESIVEHIGRCAECRGLVDEVGQNLNVAARLSSVDTRVTRIAHSGNAKIPGIVIEAPISSGGQGAVYRGVQIATMRPVAVKVIPGRWAIDPMQRERFTREARLASALRHPTIVTVLDAGKTEEGDFFIVMEYVDGETLDDWRKSAPRGIAEVLRVFEQIVDGVRFAHQAGIIHRDLKSSNILVDRSGNVRILDFGLAKAENEVGVDAFTTTPGVFVGTLAFAAPEQLTGESTISDVRSDIFSLGVVFYRLLTGKWPQEPTADPREMLARRRNEAVPRPTTLVKEATSDIDTLVARMLAVEPDRRYGTAFEVLRDVHHIAAGEPIDARADEVAYVLKRLARRYKIGLVAAMSIVVVLVVSSFLIWRYADRADQARTDAEHQAIRAEESLGILIDSMWSMERSPEGPKTTLVDFLDRIVDELEHRPCRDAVGRAQLLLVASKVYTRIATPRKSVQFISKARRLLAAAGEVDPVTDLYLSAHEVFLRWSADPSDPTTGKDVSALIERSRGVHSADNESLMQLEIVRVADLSRTDPNAAFEQLEALRARLAPGRVDSDLADQIDLIKIGALPRLGRSDEALEIGETLLSRLKGKSYAERMQRMAVEIAMASSALDGGDATTAVEIAESALDQAEKFAEPGDPKWMTLRLLCGMAHYRLGEHQKARDNLEQYVRWVSEERIAYNEDAAVAARDALAAGARARGDLDEVERQNRAIRDVFLKRYPKDAANLASIEASLAQMWARIGRKAEALEMIASAVEHCAALDPSEAPLAEAIRKFAEKLRAE